MKLTVNRSEFLRALGHASAIVEQRNTIPVLSSVLLETAGDALRIVATDLNMQVALTVPASIDGEGSTTVSARLLHGIIREFQDGSQVELSLDGDRLHVVSGRSRYKLQTIKRDDFPVVQRGEATAELTLPAKDFVLSLHRVAFAQDTDAIVRPHYCGVNVETVDGEIVFVATDGKRIAWSTLPAPEEVTLSSAILPTKLVSTFNKLLADEEGDVRLTFEDRKVTAEFGSTVLTGKLVDGTYPPWRRILPKGEGKRLVVGADVLEGAVRRAALVASERTRAVKVELTTDKITVSATTLGTGDAVEEAPAVWDDGEFAAGFNSRFLLDVLSVAGDGELHAEFFGEGSNLLALLSNPDDASAKWLLAPMHV
jgi:DNA polymerase-3 subunit beta